MRYFIFSFIVVIPSLAFAQVDNFVPLIGIPGVDPDNLNIQTYLNALYILVISIAAFAAVLRLIFAGVQYILSDVITDKANAKRDIRNSLIGLLVVLGAVLILNTINPNLTNLSALNDLQPLNIEFEVVDTSCQQGTFGPGQQCLTPGTDGSCDLSRSNNLCNCNETMIAIGTEPGYRCEPTTPLEGPDATCPFTQTAGCPCGTAPSGQGTAGFVDCQPLYGHLNTDRLQDDLGEPFRINDPALPEFGLLEGPNHNVSITIAVDQAGTCGSTDQTFSDGDTHTGAVCSIRVITETGDPLLIGCESISPTPQICQ